jgi:hypothetical protein
MFQLSSNLTLFFKIFLPIFWLTFFGAILAAALFVVDDPYFLGFRIWNFRLGTAAFWLSGFALFYFTVFKLKRVDANEEFLYVNSYFKSVRYPFNNIEKIELSDYGVFNFGHITLVDKGSFGKTISFLRSGRGFRQFLEKYPDYQELVVEKK